MPYLEQDGFGSAALIRTFDLRYDLLSALVERWRLETHTFHFSCRECTVTLEDVVLQLGLPIDRSPVTGVSSFTDPAALCNQLLGDSPNDDEENFTSLKFTWLKAKFGQLSANATEGELIVISGVVDMGGCLTLLQSWTLYRMPFLASVTHQSYIYPLVNRWSIYPGIGRSHTVSIYRLMIEQYAGEGFIWMPHCYPKIIAVIPSSAYVRSEMWCTNAPIINFNVVEWYHGDRVLRQFGCIQYIPDPPCEVGAVHDINKRGKPQLDWGVKHQKFVAMWNNQMGRRPQMVMAYSLQPSLEYIQWYYSCGKPYILGGQSTVVPPHMQRPGGSYLAMTIF
ncbi:hypothetical protein Gotur_001808 [Gossypium turneri]